MSGTPAKLSHDIVEILEVWDAKGKVSHDLVEVLGAIGSYTPPGGAWTPYTASTIPLRDSTYSDECNTVTPDAKWVRRNGAGALTGDGTQYQLTLNSTTDALTQAFTDPGTDISFMAHIKGISNSGAMIGIVALDSAHSGYGLSRYSDGSTYSWIVNNYTYAGTGPSLGGGLSSVADHWLWLQRVSNVWSGRYSNDGTTWSAWVTIGTDGRVISEIGIAHLYTNANNTVQLERFNYGPVYSWDLTGFAGGGMVTQDLVEVLAKVDSPFVHVTHEVVEVLASSDGFVRASPGIVTFGHIG